MNKYFPFLDFTLWVAAIIGIITIIGTMGGCDFAVSHGMSYDGGLLLKNLLYGFICILPLMIRIYVRRNYGTE